MADASRTEESAAGARTGDGLPCSRCGVPVQASEPLHSVLVRGLPYGFHTFCYRLWTEDRGQTPRQS
jgi:hypothetical protein